MNPNLKKNLAVGRGGGGGVARVILLFKESKSEKKLFSF